MYNKDLYNEILIEDTRKKYPNAFNPWTSEEDEELLDLYENQGKEVAEIVEELGRSPKAIKEQLKRLLHVTRLPSRKKVSPEEYSRNPFSITTINPSEISDADMPKYLETIGRMEKWFETVKNYALKQASEGVYYEGYEAVLSSKLTFPDKAQVYSIILREYPELLEKCVQMKQVSTVRKAFGDEIFNERFAELVKSEDKWTLKKSKK